jgi:beta-lactamase class A
MNRKGFLACAAAVTLICAMPRRWAFPGTVAIFAQRLRDANPLLAYNDRLALPSASVIKLVIAAAVARAIDARRLDWDDLLAIQRSEIVGASESFGTAAPGRRAAVRSLMRAAIAQSDNTAANVLADRLSFARVNAVAIGYRLEQTRLRRHFMDFAARARGIDNTTSARDTGELLLGILRGARGMPSPVASKAGCRRIVSAMLEQEDRETIPAGIHRDAQIANKTGVLPDVRNDVAIVDPYGDDAYVVALLSHFEPADSKEAYARLRQISARVDELARAAHSLRSE